MIMLIRGGKKTNSKVTQQQFVKQHIVLYIIDQKKGWKTRGDMMIWL